MASLLANGMRIGAYRLQRRLGAGGMGEVWQAEHAILGRPAAIKVLQESFAKQPDIVTRFFNEARAATAISDPGIVHIYDFGRHTDGTPFIVMEMLEGESLKERLRRRGALPLADGVRLMRQVASSVGAAHARGIVHRDLKPDNIFIVADPEVSGGERTKVLDFGIAKLVGSQPGVKTNTSALLGTPTYMSPEQCRGAGQVDQRSDVYSLGCILFGVLAGRPPFVSEGTGDLIAMHLREPAPRLSALVAGVPQNVDDIVARCLSKDPTARFESGTALAAALVEVLKNLVQEPTAMTASGASLVAVSSEQTTLSSGSSVIPSSVDRSGRSRRALVVGGTAAVVLAIGFAFIATRGGSSDQDSAAQPSADAPANQVAVVLNAHAVAPAATDAPPDVALAAPPDAAAAAHASAPRPQVTPPAKKPCTEAAFTSVLAAAAPPESAVQDALSRLRKCKGTMPASLYQDIQRRLIAKL